VKILLELPNVSEITLERAAVKLQSLIEKSSSPFVKELGLLVIKTLDYDPHDVKLSNLDFFRNNYAKALEERLNYLSNKVNSKLDAIDVEEFLFWLAFYLHILQFEVLAQKNAYEANELELGAFLENNLSHFPLEIQQKIRYLSYKLGADIANLHIAKKAKEELGKLNDILYEVRNAASTVENWDTNLSSWEAKVSAQEDRLKDQLVKVNFVGLSKAFQNLAASKNAERRTHAVISIIIASLFIITPLLILYFHKTKPFDIADVYTIGPIAAFEFALLYFFRVALQNFSSAKAQLLQINLRLELCAFVEGYAEFIEPIRKKGGMDTLAKFESIIFSGISPDPQNVPSQFDGLDNLLQLVKAVKSDK